MCVLYLEFMLRIAMSPETAGLAEYDVTHIHTEL